MTTRARRMANAGTGGFAGDGGPANKAMLNGPFGVTVDSEGNLFIADMHNNVVRKVDQATAIITTVAGNGAPGFSGDGGPAFDAQLALPNSVAVDSEGNLFIADTFNNVVRKVDQATAIITTVAGNGATGFDTPSGVTVDSEGNLLIADTGNNVVRKVDQATGIITTVAGNGRFGFSGDGGPAFDAQLAIPISVTVDSEGNLLIADGNNNRVRRVDQATGIITTVAGNGAPGFSGDGGLAHDAQLNEPSSVAVDSWGNLFITDTYNNVVRKVDQVTGIITTVAGNGAPGFSGDGGPAFDAQLSEPTSVAVDSEGNLFIADMSNSVVRKVDQNGVITTVAGNRPS